MSVAWRAMRLTGLSRASSAIFAKKPCQIIKLARSVYRPTALAPPPKPQPMAVEHVPGFGVFSPTVCEFIAQRNYENEGSELGAWVMSLTEHRPLGIVELNKFVFGANPRIDILHRVVVWQRAKARAGTASVKNKAEKRGGGRKPWKQKGLGRARQGSIRSPQFKGGGVVHGPKPKSYEYSLPKKVRRMGLRVALSVRYAQGNLHLVDTFEDVEDEKDLIPALDKQGWTSAILVDSKKNPKLKAATVELDQVDVLHSLNLSVYPILLRHNIVLSLEAVRQLEERLCEDDRIIINQFE